jgi:broad specificity phosphatase PhoE
LGRTLQEPQQTHVSKRHKSILVVTHGDALQAAATAFMGPTINVYDLKYCAMMVLDAHGKLQSHYVWLLKSLEK